MSERLNAFSSRKSTDRSERRDVFSAPQVSQPANRYLTEVTQGDGDYCVLLCTLPPGVVVPLHGHADRETFYVISGTPDAFMGNHWETLVPGDVFDARNGIRHAWRNSAPSNVTMLCTTTMRMARFLRDATIDDGSADAQAQAQHFLTLVQRHGYWLASPDENAAIGLSINWDALRARVSGTL